MGKIEETRIVDTPMTSANNGVQQGIAGISEASELKRKSVRGGAAIVLNQGVVMGLQIVTTIVLARLLSPADYGLQAMVLTLTGFFSLFRDAGLSVASVQRETLSREQVSTLFWINQAIGVSLMIVVAASAPLVAAFYKDPRLYWITIASATIFFLHSLSIQHRALLDRAMRITTSVKIDILACTIGAAVAIVMAALGYGYWALICQNIALPLVGTLAVWIAMPWMPGKPRWTPELRSMVRFGSTVTLNSFIVYVAYNAEKVLLGRYWGSAPLGLYGRAYQLTNLPVQQLTGSMGSVAFPMLSRLQGDPVRLQRSHLKVHSLVVSLTVPVVITCALFADEIVRLMLGPKWNGAAPIVRYLAPTMLVFALLNPFSWFLRATGRVARSLKAALVICPVVIVGVAVGLHWGPTGVAIGYSAAMVLLYVPMVAWSKYKTGITTADYIDAIKRPLIAGAVSGLAGWAVGYLNHGFLRPVVLLGVEVTVSFVVYGVILLFVMGQKAMYTDLIREALGRNRSAAAA
jgi:O-antigen/teichoic acid export membrane protein